MNFSEPTAFDFETALIGPGQVAPPPACVSWATTQGSGIIHWTEAGDFLRELFSASVPIVGANTAYDMGVAGQWWPELLPIIFSLYERGLVHDVQTSQKMIDIASGDYFKWRGRNSLADLSLRLLKKKLPKEDTWRLRYAELIPVPLAQWPEDAITYSVRDSEATIAVHHVQREAPADVFSDEAARNRAHWALHLMQCWGLTTDTEAVEALRLKTVEEMGQLEDELKEIGLLVWNKKDERYTKKRKLAQDMIFEALPKLSNGAPVEVPKLTPKGKKLRKDKDTGWEEWFKPELLSTDKEGCEDSCDDRLIHFARYSTLDSFLSGPLKQMATGQIHTRFDPLMETGRTSSSGPNIQNIRREEGARECFVPRPGNVFIDCDYSGAELHTLSQVCINLFGRSNLADALNNGYDPHTGLGAQLAHVTYEQAAALIEAGDPAMKEWRRRAKPGNFGFPGGMGPHGMRVYAKGMGVEMTLEEAKHLKASWAQQWPVVAHDYLPWIGNLIGADDFAWLQAFGSGLRRGKVKYCAAANFFFQTMCASGALRAAFEIAKECYLVTTSPLYGCRPVNFIHDEFLVEAPIDRAPEAAWRLRDVMVREFNVFTKDVPVDAEPALMDRWSKKAKTIYDANGRLAVWRYAA